MSELNVQNIPFFKKIINICASSTVLGPLKHTGSLNSRKSLGEKALSPAIKDEEMSSEGSVL